MTTLYQLVLRCFPADFRARHGAAMTAQFDEQRRLLRSRPGATAGLWVRALIDAIRHGLALRFGARPKPPRPSPLPVDLHQAWRSLVARKGTAATSIALLAMALTVSTTIFSIVDALLLRPAPFPDPHRLVAIYSNPTPATVGLAYMPANLARLWQRETSLFAGVGAYQQGGAMIIGGGTRPERVAGIYASPEFFLVLGVRPVIGRTFVNGEGAPGADGEVIISDSLWRARYNRSPDAVGQSLTVNDTPLTIVGVMPSSFGYPRTGIRLWRPLDLASLPSTRTVQVIARAGPGLTLEALAARVSAVGAEIMAQATPAQPHPGASVRRLDQASLSPGTRQSLWLLTGATLVLLITAGANLASLTMAQVVARTRQMAIQSALGASRARLVRQAVLEQGAIGLLGLAVAAPLSWFVIQLARALMPDAYTVWTMHVADLDLRATAVMVVLAFAVPVAAGLLPAVAGSKTVVVELLKQEGRSTPGSRGSVLLRQILVVTEVVCAVVLLVAGALLVRSFIRLQSVDRGFDTQRLVYATFSFPTREFPSPLSRRLFIDRALAVLPHTPGVSAVTQTSGVPPDAGLIEFGNVALDGGPPGKAMVELPIYVVPPDFFAVTGIPIAQGRAFRADDGDDRMIVGASFAASLWPGRSPIGHRFSIDSTPWRVVVGVAGEVRSMGLDDTATPFEAYYPYVRPDASTLSAAPVPSTAAFSGLGNVLLRTDETPNVVPAVWAALTRVDPHIVIERVDRVEDLYRDSVTQQRMIVVLMTAFSLAGLVIAAIGVYSVLSNLVSQQMAEIAVRLMLGAEPSTVSASVVRRGLALTGVGITIGVGLAALSGRLMGSVLFGVRATDTLSYGVVVFVLAVVAWLAAWLPARRAGRVDPAVLLRES